MRRPVLLALAVLPLLAFDCGEPEPEPLPAGACRLEVRGAVSEDLLGFAHAVDYHDLDANTTAWAFQLGAANLAGTVEAQVDVFLPARPVPGTTYGYGVAGVESVDAAMAQRAVLDGGTMVITNTHLADDLLGVGSVTITFAEIPPPGASNTPAATEVHGTLDAVLPPDEVVGGNVTFHARF